MDQEAFASACAWAAARLGQGGIGTLGEKSLHAALKYYFEPCPENHEQPLGGFVADAVGEHGVIEIQSRSLFKLIPKLDAFLEACPVTVVHPLIGKKWVAWYTPEGVPVSCTRAPGKLRLTDAVPELYSEASLAAAPRRGYKTVFWSFAYVDWLVDQQPDPAQAYNRMTEAAHGGGIYLLHSVSATNCAVLGDVIDSLRQQGYRL